MAGFGYRGHVDFLVGQPRVTRALRNALQKQRLGHGLLFLGESGVGRERAALGLASALLCEQRGAAYAIPWGCGACSPCRRARSGNHPDVHLVMSEAEAIRRGRAQPDGKRKPSHDILVDALRELAGRLRLTAFEGGARVAIVIDAHRMNMSSQNALLKTLEEPGADTVVILVAPHERAVLPTIASRCMRLVFAPLAEGEVRTVLEGLGKLDAHERARRARGSVTRALAIELLPERNAEVKAGAEPTGATGALGGVLWSALVGPDGAGGTSAARLDAAEAAGKERGDVELALAGLQDRLAEAARFSAAGGAGPLSWRVAQGLLDRVQATRVAIGKNASIQLALEELLLTRDPAARPGRAMAAP